MHKVVACFEGFWAALGALQLSSAQRYAGSATTPLAPWPPLVLQLPVQLWNTTCDQAAAVAQLTRHVANLPRPNAAAGAGWCVV